MKSHSCFSTSPDPYRAGAQLGRQLLSIQPEVVFLFSSIHFDGSTELMEGIYDALGTDSTAIIGCTDDGFYEREEVGDVGTSALGLSSGGAVRWRVEYEGGVGQDPFIATKRCMDRLNTACDERPAFYFLATDFRTDMRQIIAALHQTAGAPIIGGAAGDNGQIARSFVYVNRRSLIDCVALLAADGPVEHKIFVAHTLQPVGRTGRVTKVDGTRVVTIDDLPAMDFIERALGVPIDAVDQGSTTLSLTDQRGGGGRRVRSVFLPGDRSPDTDVHLLGSVDEGDWATVCLAPPHTMLQDIRDLAAEAKKLPFRPVAGLIVSCAGRKKVLGSDVGMEVSELVRCCPSLTSLAGFPSFGEMGPVEPVDGPPTTRFHNMTFILLLIGSSS